MWNKISLYKFQQIEAINEKIMPDIDKLLFSTCVVFDYTEFELDHLPLKKVSKLIDKTAEIFSTSFNPAPAHRIGKYFINYNISKITLGQYIELSFFMLNAPIQNAHYLLATVSNKWLQKNKSSEHRVKAEYFLTKSVSKIIGSLSLLIKNFTNFNSEYKSLFGLDKEVTGDVQENIFNKRYGWIYSASQIAEYERITLDEAFRLPIRQAFNDLGYLKAKMKYEMEQIKLE